MLGAEVTVHGLLGQELGALDVLDALVSPAPAGEGLIHLPFARGVEEGQVVAFWFCYVEAEKKGRLVNLHEEMRTHGNEKYDNRRHRVDDDKLQRIEILILKERNVPSLRSTTATTVMESVSRETVGLQEWFMNTTMLRSS